MSRDLPGQLVELQSQLPPTPAGRPAPALTYRAEYSLTGGLEAAQEGSSWLRLEADWTGRTVGPLLDAPPLDARTVLRASLGPGEQRLSVAGAALYAELETLRGLLAGLTAGEIVWNLR